MPLQYLNAPGPSLGMMSDIPSWEIPPGGVYDSLNLLYDRPGTARLRMGSTNLVSGSQTAFCTSIGFVRADDAAQTEELYGLDGKTGNIYVINKTTGAATLLTGTAATGIIGRPTRHFGFLIFPSTGATLTSPMVAGQTSTTTFNNTANAGAVAGSAQITLTGADVTTNVKVGATVAGQVAGGVYVGRVVSIDTTKKFSVWPVPSDTLTFPGGALTTAPVSVPFGGRCVASFQNRMLWGNTFNVEAYATSSSFSITDRRINYSVLPTENGNNVLGNTFGAGFYAPLASPFLNFIEVPGSDPIVAMEPVNDNQLLILTNTRPILFQGDLVTQLDGTNPTVTFDLSEVQGNGTCISDLGVQHTTKGVVWAGYGGIYAWNGREPIDLTDKKINAYWRAKVLGSSFALHGASYVRGHYVVSYSSGGTTEALAVNLATGAWTRFNGVGTDVFLSAARPTQPAQVYAARWWDQAGAAPSMTNGQVLRVETMFKAYTPATTTLDADGNPVLFSVTSPVLSGDPATQKNFVRGTVMYQQASATAATSVQARAGIDAADTLPGLVTLGSLSSTSTLTVTAATNANPIVCTTATHGLQTGDFVDILGGLGNTHVNGRWRVVVISPTTFSLIGSIGNAAYTASSANVRKVTEQDFQMTDLGRNQGCVFVIGAGVAVNNFELHGLRVAYLGLAPVMSA